MFERWVPDTAGPDYDYTREPFSRGECAIAHFGGQSRIEIPRSLVEAVGPDTIDDLAIDFFTLEVLEKTCWGRSLFTNYY